MSWLFSRALVEEYSAAICLDGDQSAQSNSIPTPQAFLPSDRMMDFSRPSRFGMTFGPLTDTLGADVLTWFLEGFPAKTSAQQARVAELTAPALGSGGKWPESLARFSPDSSLWKTAQCSLFGDLDESLETWPKWGLMLDGECWELPTLARPISENEFGFWPTPTAVTATGGAALCKWGGSGARAKLRTMVTEKELNGPLNPQWVSWLMGWPLGWSSLLPLETDRFQQWQRQHSECFQAQSEFA